MLTTTSGQSSARRHTLALLAPAVVVLATVVLGSGAGVASAAPAPAAPTPAASTPADPTPPATPTPAPTPAEVLPPRPVPATPQFPAWIDDLASYDAQATCSAVAQPGAVGLAELVKATYPAITTIGITRGCTQGATSEHKEGRAIDVMLDGTTLEGRAVAAAFLGWLTADDQYGNTAAMARRLGVMYVIWNKQMWRAYRPEAGWQPYTGAEAHADHIHISLSWAGALKRTTWWSLDPMTTPGIHLIDGQWWNVDCTYGAPPKATCTVTVKTQLPVYDTLRKYYALQTAWVRNRTVVLDALSPSWDANPLSHSGEFVSGNGRRWKVTCSAEAPAPRTCQTFVWSSVLVASPAKTAATRRTRGKQTFGTRYVRQQQFVLNSEVRLQDPPPPAPVPAATPAPLSAKQK